MTEQRGWIDGTPGECLFHRPYPSLFRENPVPDLFRKLDGINDDRLTAVVTALIVEDRLDHLLSRFMPRYRKLADAEQCTFSLKIRLLEALNLVPARITAMADCLRQIRNEFAHDLATTTFDGLPSKLRDRIVGLRNDICLRSDGPAPSLSHAIDNLRFFCVLALDLYSVNVQALREAITDKAFLDELRRVIDERGESQLKEVVSKPPMSIERHGDTTVTRYEGGVVDIHFHGPFETSP
jgi:hypothetical protein